MSNPESLGGIMKALNMKGILLATDRWFESDNLNIQSRRPS